MATDYIPYLRKMIGHAKCLSVGLTTLIINEKGEILLEKRADNGKYCLPGGSIDLDETVIEGAKREVYEETGIKLEEISLFSVRSGSKTDFHYPNGDVTQYVDLNFIAYVNSEDISLKKDSESTYLAFVSPDALPEEKNILPGSYAILKKYLAHDLRLSID